LQGGSSFYSNSDLTSCNANIFQRILSLTERAGSNSSVIRVVWPTV